MNEIRLISHSSGTIVFGECEGLAERKDGIAVHYREDEHSIVCPNCGGPAVIWMASQDRWSQHPARCSTVLSKATIDSVVKRSWWRR